MGKTRVLWWCRRGEGRERPCDPAEIERMIRSGELTGAGWVRRDDWRQWVQVSSVPEFQRLLESSPLPRASLPIEGCSTGTGTLTDNPTRVTADEDVAWATVVAPPPAMAQPQPVHTNPIEARPAFDHPVNMDMALRDPPPLASGASEWHDRELEDPMREIARRFGWYLWFLFFVVLTSSFVGLSAWALAAESPLTGVLWSGLYFLWILFFAYWGNLLWWRAFAPRRATDVFYLRSFQNDQASWPIRVAIQAALGERYRLSGIRDPRRRVTAIQDRLSPWLKAMRHCTPKFMDLEAGHDWKARLWRSLQSGRMAVIDLTEVTPFIREEVQLVSRAIGLERTVFLGTQPQSESQIRQMIAQEIGATAAANARVLIWPGNPTTGAVRSATRQFQADFRRTFDQVGQRPPIQPTRPPQQYLAVTKGEAEVPMSRSMIRWMMGFQILLLMAQVVVTFVANWITSDPGYQSALILLASVPFWTINGGLFLWNFAVYIYNVGILRRRLKASFLMALVVLTSTTTWLQVYWLREGQRDLRVRLSETERQADRQLMLLEDQGAKQ